MSTTRKKKPAKPSPSLLSRLVHIRAELDDLIRAAEQQAGYTVRRADWKARCKIVEPPDGYWDVMSPCGVYWWGPSSACWFVEDGSRPSPGRFRTYEAARRALADCTVPPPGEANP